MFGVGLKDFEVRLSWYIWHKSKRLGEISNHGIKFNCSAPLWEQNGLCLVGKKNPKKHTFSFKAFFVHFLVKRLIFGYHQHGAVIAAVNLIQMLQFVFDDLQHVSIRLVRCFNNFLLLNYFTHLMRFKHFGSKMFGRRNSTWQ